ncbi:MAG: L,D-transpeptidase family protein, partial [Saprospiraceae bacterium]
QSKFKLKNIPFYNGKGIDEYLLVRHNPWIIDTLAHTDYYYQSANDSFVYDQKEMLVFRANDTLFFPSAAAATALRQRQQQTVLDLNIPEFKLRIYEAGQLLHTFPVRVGRDEQQYLAMANREVDLRTYAGTGKIVRINRDPAFINPVNNKRYDVTRRDDKRVTRLPLVPWLEPEINGHRYGQLIHPTTNPKTLGKAYSNGCIGTRVGDMWRIYYYAPLGTPVNFRYDLNVEDANGNPIRLKDIYPNNQSAGKNVAAIFPSVTKRKEMIAVCECR